MSKTVVLALVGLAGVGVAVLLVAVLLLSAGSQTPYPVRRQREVRRNE